MTPKLVQEISGSQARTALSGALLAVFAATLTVAAGPLAAVPVLFAFVPLLAGRYLGAEALDRLIDSRYAASRPRSPRRIELPPAHLAVAERGASLLARSLAKRPPPAVALT